MELDARTLSDGAVLEADLCIVGAGPAGLTLAREFNGLNLQVVILESGGRSADERIQALNQVHVVGDQSLRLAQTRYRGVGGTVHTWNTPVHGHLGAKYAPLDPWDFEERDAVASIGWPFGFSQLEPLYRRAQMLCGLGHFAYDGNHWAEACRPCLGLAGDRLVTRVYQFGVRRPFVTTYVDEVRASPNIRLCHHATVCQLETGGSDHRISAARVVCLSGPAFTVRARTYAIAGGAIENARLLLASGLGAESGWLGRCFMEHPRDSALTLVTGSEALFREAAFYDAHAAEDGTVISGRIALAAHTVSREDVPNASVSLLPMPADRPVPTSPVGRLWERLRERVRPRPLGGYGWSRIRRPARAFRGFRLLVNLEQRPDPQNRVVLLDERDVLGVPRVAVQWRWQDGERAALERLRRLLVDDIERSGIGNVHVRTDCEPDPNAHHHAGTTRMARDPRDGVVDPDGRVHDMENLYVAGASVFPSAGFANPTLTIVALALKLADHLRARLR